MGPQCEYKGGWYASRIDIQLHANIVCVCEQFYISLYKMYCATGERRRKILKNISYSNVKIKRACNASNKCVHVLAQYTPQSFLGSTHQILNINLFVQLICVSMIAIMHMSTCKVIDYRACKWINATNFTSHDIIYKRHEHSHTCR